MNKDKILTSLKEIDDGMFPYEAVREAIDQQDLITPDLLDTLSFANNHLDYLEKHPRYMAHLYAMFLLAQFREERAYPLVTNFFSQPDRDYDAITGDFYLEDLPRVLASVCHNDVSLIKQMIENEDVDQWVRGSGIKSLVVLVSNTKLSRKDVMDYFKSLFHGKLEKKPSHVWNSLILHCCMLQPEEVYTDIKQAYDEGLADPTFLDMNDVQYYMNKNWANLLVEMQNDRHYSFVNDTIEDMEWWSCFDSEEQKRLREKRLRKRRIKLGKKIQRKRKKIGRNDPCPCGSGKKYKKCCGSLVKK